MYIACVEFVFVMFANTRFKKKIPYEYLLHKRKSMERQQMLQTSILSINLMAMNIIWHFAFDPCIIRTKM